MVFFLLSSIFDLKTPKPLVVRTYICSIYSWSRMPKTITFRTQCNSKLNGKITFATYYFTKEVSEISNFVGYNYIKFKIFFQTSALGNALNLNLPPPVQQFTHGQMELYPHGVILSCCNLKKSKNLQLHRLNF